MSRRQELVLIVCAVGLAAALASHLTARGLGILTTLTIRSRIGAEIQRPPALTLGSSLVGYGIDWNRVAQTLGSPVDLRSVPFASPCELVELQREVPEAALTFVGVSVYDLNEHALGDFRASVVPFREAVRGLWRSGADWSFTKRVLSQYPVAYLRVLFPTAGRATGVMVGLRAQGRRIWQAARGASPALAAAGETGPTLAGQGAGHEEKITDWTQARLLRNLAQLRGACLGRHAFAGPKKLALEQLLKTAAERGPVVVLVFPVAPAYEREFLNPEARASFAQALDDLERRVPGVRWVRLDLRPDLAQSELYWDLVHLNVQGQKLATRALLAQLPGWGLATATAVEATGAPATRSAGAAHPGVPSPGGPGAPEAQALPR